MCLSFLFSFSICLSNCFSLFMFLFPFVIFISLFSFFSCFLFMFSFSFHLSFMCVGPLPSLHLLSLVSSSPFLFIFNFFFWCFFVGKNVRPYRSLSLSLPPSLLTPTALAPIAHPSTRQREPTQQPLPPKGGRATATNKKRGQLCLSLQILMRFERALRFELQLRMDQT